MCSQEIHPDMVSKISVPYVVTKNLDQGALIIRLQ